MTSCLTFRTDAAGDIGFGHLRRCLTLAETAAARGHEVSFLLSEASDDAATDLLKGIAGRIERIGGGARPTQEISALAAGHLVPCDVMIADIAHARVLAQRERIPAYLTCLHRPARRLAVLEGLGSDAITSEADGIAELIVTPYAFDPATTLQPRRSRQLIGAEYAILDAAYRSTDVEERQIAEQGRRILLTTGGSDPTGVAPRALLACESVASAPLELHVVIGPFFSSQLRDDIARLAEASRHHIALVEAPGDLRAEMLWCDLAISTTGLTKYELAATGTPAILLSHDRNHARNNEAFSALGTAEDLGETERLDAAALAETIARLLASRTERQIMSRRGRQAIDGRGAARIIDAIEELIL